MTSTSPHPRPTSFPPLERRAPEAVGIPAAALAALADRLQEEGLDPHALLVARGGVVAFETAWAPYRLEQPALVYSVSKTYTSLAIGFLVDEGRLGLDDSVGDLLGLPNPHGITVRHLLTMNTGHSPEQIERYGFSPAGLLATAPERAPGTRFAYNSPATYALSAIIARLAGEQLTAYLRPRLLEPLGIGDRWMSSVDGIETGASGFHLTVDDIARTAIMLGAGGVFGGAQVAPRAYVDEMSRVWSDTAEFEGPAAAEDEVNDWSLGYGYQMWRSRHGYRLDGAAGQFGLIIPESDLVIAYHGATLDTQATLRAFWAFVDAVAVADAATVDAEAAPTSKVPVPTALHVSHDTWDSRADLGILRQAPFDADGLTLTDTADGWTLDLPGVGELKVGGSWTETEVEFEADAGAAAAGKQAGTSGSVVDAAGIADPACSSHAAPTRLVLATRGERRDDGSVLIHIVDTTSPHRAIVHRAADSGAGAVDAGWHIPPLGGGWEILRVPASVLTSERADTARPESAAPAGNPGDPAGNAAAPAETTAAALLLDMDGTLVDSHEVVERLWRQWSEGHGIDPARTLSIIHGRQGQDSMALLLPDRPHEVNLAENRELLAAETAQTDGVVAIPGAAALLAALRGLPHALVTSASLALAQARMDAAGLPVPSLAITAEDVTRSKPDPEGFLAAARALGVDPASCIVVEDSPNGIAAGLAAGMRVIGIGPHAAGTGATWVVPDASGIRVASAEPGIAVTIGA